MKERKLNKGRSGEVKLRGKIQWGNEDAEVKKKKVEKKKRSLEEGKQRRRRVSKEGN